MDATPPPPTYRVPDNIAWIDGADFDLPDDLYLTYLPSGRTVRLTGSSRVIWLIASDGGDALTEVPEIVGRPRAEIESHVTQFIAELLNRGLLAPATGDTGTP